MGSADLSVPGSQFIGYGNVHPCLEDRDVHFHFSAFYETSSCILTLLRKRLQFPCNSTIYCRRQPTVYSVAIWKVLPLSLSRKQSILLILTDKLSVRITTADCFRLNVFSGERKRVVRRRCSDRAEDEEREECAHCGRSLEQVARL